MSELVKAIRNLDESVLRNYITNKTPILFQDIYDSNFQEEMLVVITDFSIYHKITFKSLKPQWKDFYPKFRYYLSDLKGLIQLKSVTISELSDLLELENTYNDIILKDNYEDETTHPLYQKLQEVKKQILLFQENTDVS